GRHASDAQKSEMLRNIQELGGRPDGATDLDPDAGVGTGRATLGDRRRIPRFQFNGATGPAIEHTVTVRHGARTYSIPVVLPERTQPGMMTPTIDQIQQGLERLPESQLRHVRQVVANPIASPDTRSPFGEDLGTDMSTTGDGRIMIYPRPIAPPPPPQPGQPPQPPQPERPFDPRDLARVLTHELGHVASIQAWGEDLNGPGWTRWKN